MHGCNGVLILSGTGTRRKQNNEETSPSYGYGVNANVYEFFPSVCTGPRSFDYVRFIIFRDNPHLGAFSVTFFAFLCEEYY